MDGAGRLLYQHQTSVCELAEVSNNPAEAKKCHVEVNWGKRGAVYVVWTSIWALGQGSLVMASDH